MTRPLGVRRRGGRPPFPRSEPPPPVAGAHWVALTRGKFALVDPEDADLGGYNWIASVRSGRSSYAWRHLPNGSGVDVGVVQLHQEVARRMGIPVDAMIDHKNGDGLDCRRENLRAATYAQNAANRPGRGRSGFKGVVPTRSGKWHAGIGYRGQKISLGTFGTAQEAADAYDAEAVRLYGEFAWTNRRSRP